MAPQGDAYHIDWICSNASNVHMANNKEWFTNLTEFKSKLGSIYQGPNTGADVLGVGDVELEVVKSVTPSGKKTFRTFVLRDVVYAPANIVNLFASSPVKGYHLDFSSNKFVDANTGQDVGMFDTVKLSKLWLKGQPRGKTSLDPNGLYMINATWPAEEQARWEFHKRKLAAGFEARYNDEEKQWLKKHFGNEFKFLQQHGLSIYKDEDRDEGKQIVKTMMADDPEEDEEEEEEEENSFLADLEADPASHLADYHFNDAELDWIEKHHRHSGNFLRVYGLKPWDDEDCKEGKAIIQGFLG